jgi:hypothetical protein
LRRSWTILSIFGSALFGLYGGRRLGGVQTKARDEADDVFDRIDPGLPARSPEEAAAREPYERLITRIRDLDKMEPPPGWEDRAVARWRRERTRRRAREAGTGVPARLMSPLNFDFRK